MTDPLDEDADIRSNLAVLGPDALRELQDVLTWPQPTRDEVLRSLVGRRHLEPLAQLIAIADTDKAARLRLLRAMRDLDEGAIRARSTSVHLLCDAATRSEAILSV